MLSVFTLDNHIHNAPIALYVQKYIQQQACSNSFINVIIIHNYHALMMVVSTCKWVYACVCHLCVHLCPCVFASLCICVHACVSLNVVLVSPSVCSCESVLCVHTYIRVCACVFMYMYVHWYVSLDYKYSFKIPGLLGFIVEKYIKCPCFTWCICSIVCI